ncbi:hypothetical protein HYC85_022736, partial [Camellia sinensis]
FAVFFLLFLHSRFFFFCFFLQFYFPFCHLLLYYMGRSEDMISPKSEKPCPKSEKASPPKQAYYGPGVPIPPSYLNSSVMACHVPHPHVWAPPQHVMPPYGVPYSAIYSPGVIATPVSAQMLSTSSYNMDQGSIKKLKRLDGVTKQVVNDNAEVDGEGSAHGASQSIDVSSDASDGNTRDERQLKREKRKHANKQSARRSRLRKQAETEELMKRYEIVKVENITLKSEMKQLMEDSEKLRVENVALMENLNGSEVAHPERRV